MSKDQRQGELFGGSPSRKSKPERSLRSGVAPSARDRRPRETLSLRDRLPDARDGLTREQRVILHTLHQVQRERGGRNVPTIMLYGRVCEHISISEDRFQQLLSQLVGAWVPGR